LKARLFIAAAFLAAAVTPLRAATITVTTTNDSVPGSLRAALANAADGDTIDASSISGTIQLTNGELLVTNSVNIVGPGPGLLAVDGHPFIYRFHYSRVFHIGSNTVVSISSLTVTNGDISPGSGGGIWNDHATLTVSNVILSGNSAITPENVILSGNSGIAYSEGGGIWNDHANLTVNACILRGNFGDYGGGAIYNDGSGGTASVQIANSILRGNRADDGGAINNQGRFGGNATIQIVNSTLSGNLGYAFGGGIENVGYGGTVSVQIANSTLSSNSAGVSGGGIDNYSGNGGFASAEVVNSTLTGNSAYRGGGFNNESATLQIVNSILSDNSAPNGGGIYNTAIANLEIGSTILNASGSDSNITSDSGTVTSLGYNLSSDDGGGFLTATGDQTDTNPMFDPAGLQDNGGTTLTIALLCGSPAIDQGKNFSGAATDQRGNGFVRTFDDCAVPNAPGGDGTDIGAYEVQLGDCPHPPIISCPTNRSVNARSPAGARVNYPTPVASNGCPVAVVCNPPSGSLFAIGNTVVSCLATDTEGNEATCSFTVHVKGAPEQIADLIALVQRLDLKPWTTYVLTAELQSASNALRRGNTRAACFDLDAFIFNVDIQTWWGQIWPPSRARTLVRNAQRIQNVLGCDGGFGHDHY